MKQTTNPNHPQKNIEIDEKRRSKMEQHTRKEKEKFEKLELIGTVEVAEILGWPMKKVSTYNLRGSIPDPIGQVGNRPVWMKRVIDDFKESQERKEAKKDLAAV